MKTDNPATDMVCFHMQQCVEKYLKAFDEVGFEDGKMVKLKDMDWKVIKSLI